LNKPIEFVVNNGECWLCISHKGGKGYPVTKINQKHYSVHRLFYEKFIGPIPEGMEVCHKCDNPQCINPDHLFIGTHADNMRDMCAKGRNNYILPPVLKGELNPGAKLSPSQVLEIRKDERKRKEIAEQYHISLTTVCEIKNRIKWKHLV